MCVWHLLYVIEIYRIYGPNSEIEWNKEGARGFSILARTAPQTALSVVADRAAKLGDELNSGLLRPICTNRDRLLFPSDENVENSHQIVTSDPVLYFFFKKKSLLFMTYFSYFNFFPASNETTITKHTD